MNNDKRDQQAPIPDNLDAILSEFQLMALHRIENFGWELHFVRRPMFQVPTVVVFSADGKKIGVLEDDGRINMNSDIKLREGQGCVLTAK
jgi:hypothetical protein